MNLEFVSTIAEIVAAIGVIFSLLYLAKQIRSSSNTENARAFESAINSFHLATGNLLEDSNRELFMKGLVEYEDLSESEMFKFHALSAHIVDRFEIMLQFEALGITDKGHLSNMIGPMIKDWLTYPGFRTYFERELPYFSKNMQTWYRDNAEGGIRDTTGYIGEMLGDSSKSSSK